MKKLMLFIVAAGIAFFASCDNEPPEPPEGEPFPPGAWRTTHQHFSLTVDNVVPLSFTEQVKEEREQEASGDVLETESYRLSFEEDGTGIGSGVLPDRTGRYDFEFTWQLSDDELSIAGVDAGSDIVFYTHTGTAVKNVDWMIEESEADEMVLVWIIKAKTFVTDGGPSWDETHTYRYTFERVE